MNRVEIGVEGLGAPVWVDRLRVYGESILSLLDTDGWDVSVLLCNEAVIRDLNLRYRGIDEATDVLSFAIGESFMDEEIGQRWLAGDIVISLDNLEKNAEYFKVDKDEELRRLLIHGLLHLSGLDHEDNAPDRPMLRRQEELLQLTAKERVLL